MRKISTLILCICFAATTAFAQNRTVKGKVTDESGNPIPNVTVTVKGSKKATSADASGNFSIEAGANDLLEFSSVGFKKSSAKATGGTVSVSLAKEAESITEVTVVTTNNKKVAKREIGTATTIVTGEELNKGKALTIASGLAGKVAGVTVTQPNSGVDNDFRIVFRGNRSLGGNNQPILVLDGSIVPISYMNSINNNDVESLNILKGAGATAVYGNEASNGAIIITTKKGSKIKPVITVSSTVNMESVSYMPKLQNDFGSDGGEAIDQYGKPLYIPYENQSFGPRYNGKMVMLGLPVKMTRADGTTYWDSLMVPYSGRPDEKRKFFKNAMTFQNDVSFSTGDNNGGLFFVSVQDARRNGTVPGDTYRRNSIRLNASRDLKNFSVAFNINYTKSVTDQVYADERGGYMYEQVLQTPSHIPITSLQDVENNPYAKPTGYYNAYYGNPYWTIKNSRDVVKADNILSNLEFTYKPLSWMSASYRVSYTNGTTYQEVFRKPLNYESWYPESVALFDQWGGAGGQKINNVLSTGYRGDFNNQRLQGDFTLSFNKKFHNNDIDTKLLLGHSVYQIKNTTSYTGYDANTGSLNNYTDVGGPWGPAYAVGTPLSYYTSNLQHSQGMFADFTIGYKRFLFLEATVRRDVDSRLESENRAFTYPAANVSFILTDAFPGIKKALPLNFAKIRGSIAKVGNIRVGPYSTRNVFLPATAYGFPFTNAAGLNIDGFTQGGTFNNKNLKPEFTNEKEMGIELAWFKNRLLTNFNYYITSTTNQTLAANISAATGRTAALQNVGELQNKGYEVEITGIIVQSKNVTWDLGFGYTRIDNKVVSITPDITELALNTTQTSGLGGGIYAIAGSPFPILKTTDWNRDPQGRIIVDTKTGNGSKNSAVGAIGTTQAPNTFSFKTSLRVGKITLSAVAEHRSGAVVLNALGTTLDFSGISANSATNNREPFVIANSSYFDPSKGTYVPNTSIVTNTGSGSQPDANAFWTGVYRTVGTNYVTSADFWKIREVAISYELPMKLLSKAKIIKAATFSIVGRDLFMFLPKENVWTDPEFSNTTGNGLGITNLGETPQTRKIGVSLNLTF